MRSLFQNGMIQTKLPSHLTRRPTPPSRPQLHRTRHQRTKATEAPNPSKDAHNPPSNNPDPQPKSSEPTGPPPAGTVASSAGAPTPPVTGPASRSLTQIIRTGPVGRVGRSYARMQERRPYWTQLYSSVVVYLAADLSAQFLFPSGPPVQPEDEGEGVKKDNDGEKDGVATGQGWAYDPLRTLRHLFIGVTSGIPSYNWFMFLHRNFNFASRILSISTKVIIQQLVFTPVFNSYFFSLHSLLAGATLSETFERLKVALPVSFVNSCKLWPAVTAFSFAYVPPQFRNVFSGVVAIGWQTYLSWLNQKAARQVEIAEVEEEVMAKTEQVGLPAGAGAGAAAG